MGWHLHGRTFVKKKFASFIFLFLFVKLFSFSQFEKIEKLETQNMPLPTKYKTLDIMGSDDALVEKFRKTYLQKRNLKMLSKTLEEAEDLRLYVREKLQEKKMPATLEYLPLIESNYNAKAKSKSGALGLWQFMSNSTGSYLVRNEFVDERLDAWKSTDAALAKLQDNYKIFHDWPLALAAYNLGSGAVSRLLKKHPNKNFWDFAHENLIRKETIDYVPKLLAIADIAENARFYNIALPTARNENGEASHPFASRFDFVEVNDCISIAKLANELRLDDDELLYLNASLLLGITPPKTKFKIRFPYGMKKSAEDALARLQKTNAPISYMVKKNETLYSIAKKFKVSIDALARENEIDKNEKLHVGKNLAIPREVSR